MAGIQKIRLSQIVSNMNGVRDFEEQLVKMRSTHEEKIVATENQTTITLSKEYAVGNHQLNVYLNGIRVHLIDDYLETNSRMITFTEPLQLGDVVVIQVHGDINAVIDNGMTEIYRDSYVILSQNEGQVDFVTAVNYTMNSNSLEVYRDGILLEKGPDKDYVEVSNNSFKLNYTVPTGTVITVKIYV